MIEVTIKTLDSRNHAFSVEDEFTVKQLKEHIAGPVEVPAESQRLIYCGRVLIDDKKLSEYDVNGKVIHLVQRAPPSSTPDTGNIGGETRSTTRRGGWMFNPGVRMEGTGGNAMYLGAMAFPADLMDSQDIVIGVTVPNPRRDLAQGRINVVRLMLRRARATLTNLSTEGNARSEESPPEDDTNGEAAATAPVPVPASASAVAEPQDDPSSAESPTVTESPLINTIEALRRLIARGEGAAPAEESEERIFVFGENDESPPAAAPPSEEPTNSARSTTNGRSRLRSSPVLLADLVDQIRDVHTRFTPFLDRYYNLMRDDPPLENSTDSQRLFNHVSEVMHSMAHAYHAISDIMCDFSQPPPRALQCRPVIIQHSAVLQAGIPIQLNLGRGTQNRSTATSNAEGENSAEGRPSAEPAAASAETSTSAQRERRSGRDESQRRSSLPSEPIPRVGAGGFEFFVDVGQGSITIDSADGSVLAEGAPPGGDRMSFLQAIQRAVRNNTGSNQPPPGSPPMASDSAPAQNIGDPSEFFIQALDQVQQVFGDAAVYWNPSSVPVASTPTDPAAATSAPATSASTRAQTDSTGTAQTQPTTSTQTRSTSRPQVHFSPRPRYPVEVSLRSVGTTSFPLEVSGDNLDLDSVDHMIHSMGGGNGNGSGNIAADSIQPDVMPTGLLTRLEVLGRVRRALDGMRSDAPSAPTSEPSGPAGSPPSTTTASTRTQTEFPPLGSAFTQPTTSTQTRSTTRPHVHVSPGLQGMGALPFFDPFLPCNSHHRAISSRTSRRRNVADLEATLSEIRASRRPAAAPAGAASEPTPSASEENDPIPRVIRIPQMNANELEPVLVLSSQGPPREFTFTPGTTFMDFAQSAPNQPVQPDSIVTEMFGIVARNLLVQDVFDMNFRRILSAIRPRLSRFFQNRVLQNLDGPQAIRDGVNRLIAGFRTFLDSYIESLEDIPLREDVDMVATINQLNQVAFPRFIQTITGSGTHWFCRNFQKHWVDYYSALSSILSFCCMNGASDVRKALMRFSVRFLREIPGMDSWAEHVVHRSPEYLNPTLPTESTRQFLVFRLGETAPVPPPTTAIPAHDPVPLESLPVAPQPPPIQPMEVEDTVEVAEAVPTAEQISEPLPDVIIGAEQWHNHVPTDWVPIITKDRERQRRQAAQGPLSEAYLSGMPSKRRKVVTSNKPHGSLARVISDSMTSAMAAAGVASMEGVAEAAGADASIRAAYKDQLRSTVGPTVRSHPDFNSDKYPNSAKLFGPK